ncbi:MAG: AI-2E family transporter [Phycisphaerae bacterium]
MSEADSDKRVQTVCLVIVAAVAVGFALRWLKPVLIPFVLALLLAIAVSPIVELLMRKLRIGRTPAILIAMLLGLVLILAAGVVMGLSVAEMAENADTYADRAEELFNSVLAWLPLDKLGITREQAVEELGASGYQAARGLLTTTSAAVTDILSKGVLVLVFFCFLVFGGSGRKAKPGSDWAGVEADVKRYTLAQLLLSASTGILVGLILWVLGIPLAGVFGMLAFLLNFIPSIGSTLAVLLPLPVALLTPEVSLLRAILAILLPGAVTFSIGNFVEPRVVGGRLGLHPIAVMMALIFWGMLWGVVGMFLAVPMTVLARRIMLKSDIMRPVAELLAGNAPD